MAVVCRPTVLLVVGCTFQAYVLFTFGQKKPTTCQADEKSCLSKDGPTCIPTEQECRSKTLMCAVNQKSCLTKDGPTCIPTDQECRSDALTCGENQKSCLTKNGPTCIPTDQECRSEAFMCGENQKSCLTKDGPTCIPTDQECRSEALTCGENQKSCFTKNGPTCIPSDQECRSEALTCDENQKHCKGKCILESEKCDCGEKMAYCDSMQRCMPEEHAKDGFQCPQVCAENEKHCIGKCIPGSEKCDCGEKMAYCESIQRCMPEERVKDGFECPQVCAENEWYCPFTKSCISNREFCSCPSDKPRACAMKKGCLASGEECPCPAGHSYCENTWACIPDTEKCPRCEQGKKYCVFQGGCIGETEACGCPVKTKFCPYRRTSSDPVCVNETIDDVCSCPDTEKPCLSLLKCIPKEKECPCREGTDYCASTGECTKVYCPHEPCAAGQFFCKGFNKCMDEAIHEQCPDKRIGCPEGKFFCREFKKCVSEDIRDQCPDKEHKGCPEGKKHCKGECILESETCECGENMTYCESRQHCMPKERVQDGFDCPQICTAENEWYCPFTKSCISKRELCRCPAEKPRACAMKKGCLASGEECPCPAGHSYCENTWACIPDTEKCPRCEQGKKYCVFQGGCIGETEACGCPVKTKFCPYRRTSSDPVCVNETIDDVCTCPDTEKPCLSLLKCIPKEKECPCREGTDYCASTGECTKVYCPHEPCAAGQFFCKGFNKCMDEAIHEQCPDKRIGCPEGKFFCREFKKCVSEDIRDQCPDKEHKGCPEGKKHCKGECILESETCECGENMTYCESRQHCMPKERVQDGFDCPQICTAENEWYCPFTKSCISKRELCRCPAEKPRACAMKKGCLASGEECHCPAGHSYCENTWACIPDTEKCPRCEQGKKYCVFQGGCIGETEACGCPVKTKFCPYRRTSSDPVCVNETIDDVCTCPDTEKPCLSLLKCIPKEKECPCREGTDYCASTGECTKVYCPHEPCAAGQFFCKGFNKCMDEAIHEQCPDKRIGCPEGKFFCREFKKCVSEDIRDQCPDKEHKGCPEGKKHCKGECILESETCECGENMTYCESRQHCMPKERVQDGFDCPQICTAENEWYCPFTKSCISKRELCRCPAEKPRACAMKKGCLASGEECHCPAGHSYCENTWACIPDTEKCPRCEQGKKYCVFQGGCIGETEACGCPVKTKFCPYRRTSSDPVCVNETIDDVCTCPDTEKPCLSLLKCIPKEKECPCREGTDYCASTGECTKVYCPHEPCAAGQFFCKGFNKCMDEAIHEQCPDKRIGCPEGKFFCREFKKCVSEDIRDQCPDKEHKGCPEGKKHCKGECILESETCECGENMTYCESRQHCMPKERVQDGFDCPQICTAENEWYCPFTKSCISKRELCRCPAEKPRACAMKKGCLASGEECHCPAGHSYCENTWACIPDTEKCPRCEQGKKYCVFQGGCIGETEACGCPVKTKFCPYRRTSSDPVCVNETIDDVCTCPDTEKPCLSLLKCIPKEKECPCREGTDYCASTGECTKVYCPHEPCAAGQFFCKGFNKCMDEAIHEQCPDKRIGCPEGKFFCREFKKCVSEDIRDQCPDKEHKGCPEGKKHCKGECILESETCECGENMTYCESRQHCMPKERVQDGFDCPQICTAENEWYCPFTKSCISKRELCRCPAEKPRACAMKKGCLASGEECPCPAGHSYCENTWACIPDTEKCPRCEQGKKYCVFQGGCIGETEACGCPVKTKFCPYRRTSSDPVCVNETIDDVCTCPDTEKPCLSLLKCIPKEKECPCREGTDYCASTGECTKVYCPHEPCAAGQFFCKGFNKCMDEAIHEQCPDKRIGCPEGKFFCREFKKCVSEDIRDQCPDKEHKGCPEGKKHCKGECILESETCECGENMTYCESRQHCMPKERVQDGFDCPQICTAENEWYCPFTKSCISKRELCRCPAEKPRACAMKKGCVVSGEECPCPAGHTYCENTWACIPDAEKCPRCEQGKKYCVFQGGCIGQNEACGCPVRTKFCPYRRTSSVPICADETKDDVCTCPDTEKPCLSLLKCIPKEKECPCPKGTEYCESNGECTKDHCPREPCPEGKVRCNSKCILRTEKCDCGDGLGYCESKESCMLLQSLQDPYQCPPVCSDTQRYCSFSKTCIPRKELCKCPAGKRGCATLKDCIGAGEVCPCPRGYSYCENTWNCLSSTEKCPACRRGQFYCNFKEKCINDGEQCGCPEDTDYCPYRGDSTLPACLRKDESWDQHCRCKDTEKPCLTLLRCIPKKNTCPCPVGTEYCESSGDCVTKREDCPKAECPEGQVGCVGGEKPEPEPADLIFAGIFYANVPEKLSLEKFKNLRFTQATVEGTLNNVDGSWQVYYDKTSRDWTNLEKQSIITSKAILRFNPGGPQAHGFEGIEIKVDGVSKYIGVLVIPCVAPKLTVKKALSGREDEPIQFNLDDVVEVTRVREGSSMPNLVEEYTDKIPKDALEEYRGVLKQTLGKNLGVQVFPIKHGEIVKPGEKQPDKKILGKTSLTLRKFLSAQPKIFSVGSTLEFKPAQDYSGEFKLRVTPVDVSPTVKDARTLSDPCVYGMAADLTIQILNINDKPVSRKDYLGKPILNVRFPPLPYEIKKPGDNAGYKIGDSTKRVGEDNDGDEMGIAVVNAKITNVGNWQYSDGDGSWQDINVQGARVDDSGKFKTENVELLFLTAEQKIRFKPVNDAKLWSKIEAMDYTRFRFLLWDQTNELTMGVHNVSWKDTVAVSDELLSATIGRLGCDDKEGSMKELNECGECGKTSCIKCDGSLDSDAKINDCGLCVFGNTKKDENHGKNCRGLCTDDYVIDTKCKVCRKRDERSNVDCNGKCGGMARINKCGRCSEDPEAGIDACGVCDGDGSTCAGCDGIPNSGKKLDICGKCLSPDSAEFDLGCVGLGTVSPNIIPTDVVTRLKIAGTGLPKRGITCQLRSGETNVELVQVTPRNPEELEALIPSAITVGKYNIVCTIGGREFTSEKSVVTVYNEEGLKITRVDPAEFDLGSNVTEVVVTGTGFIDTKEMTCVYEVEGERKGILITLPRHASAKFVSSTEVRCPIDKAKKLRTSFGIKLSISLGKAGNDGSKASTVNSNLLKWFSPAPRVVSQNYNDRREMIVVKFDRSVKQPKITSTKGGRNKRAVMSEVCEELLTAETQDKLKSLTDQDITCKLKTTLLKIELPGANIDTDFKIKFKSGTIKADAAYSRSSAPEVTITVPAIITLPKAVITAPSKIAVCDDVKISGLNSKNTGHRQFKCSWSIDVADEVALSEEAKADLLDVRELINTTKCVLRLSESNLKPGVAYTVNLTVIRGNRRSEIASHAIERSQQNLPSVRFVTEETTFNMSRATFRIKARAKRPTCVDDSSIKFLWNCDSVDLVDNDRSKLVLKREMLECDKTYDCNLRVYLATNPDLKVDLPYRFSTVAPPLATEIVGGDRVIPATGIVKLVAKSTIKYTCGRKLKYFYSCTDEDGLPCRVTNEAGDLEALQLEPSSSPELKLKAKIFQPNKMYTFALQATLGTQSIESYARITIRPGNPPTVKIDLPKTKAGTTKVYASVRTTFQSTTFEWTSVQESGYGSVDLSKLEEAKLLQGKTSGLITRPDTKARAYFKKVTLTFGPGALEPGVTYKFKLLAFSEQAPDEIGESEVTVSVNAPPSQGQLSVEPQEGISFNTSFTLSSFGFLDESRLKRRFYCEKKDGQRQLLRSSEESSTQVQLPSGDEQNEDTIKLFVSVQDEEGAKTEATALVKSKRKEQNAEDMIRQRSAIKEATESGEPMKALTISLSYAQETKGQSELQEQQIEIKEVGAKLTAEILKGDEVEDDVIMSVLPYAQPQTEETRKDLSAGMTYMVNKKVGEEVKRRGKGQSNENRRRRRAAEEELSSEEEETTVMSSDEVENILAGFENVIDTSYVDNVTRDFLQSVDSLLIRMCQDLPLGQSSVALSTLATLQSNMNYMDDVDQVFHAVSCSNCSSVNETALVKFGAQLKSLYNEWNCSSEDEPCNGVCAAMVQYPYDFLTADNSSRRCSDVVFIELKNPESLDYIPVEGLSSPIVLRLPLHAGYLENGEYQCMMWDEAVAQWSTSGCQQTQVFLQDGTVYVDCNCSRLGFTAVHAVEQISLAQGEVSSTAKPTTTQQSSTGTSTGTGTDTWTSVEPTEDGSRLTASVSMTINAVYNTIVTDDAAKNRVENILQKKLADVMQVDVSQIINVTVSSGSIIVNFVILSPEEKPTLSLNYSITQLQIAVNKREFTITLDNGIQLTADNGSVGYSYKLASGVQPDPVQSLTQEEAEKSSQLPLILGCVFGALLVIVIVVAVVLRSKVKQNAKVSHADIKISETIKNNCAKNTMYQAAGEKGASETTSLGDERPPSAEPAPFGSSVIRQAAELPTVQ